jgi:hypothetical protein
MGRDRLDGLIHLHRIPPILLKQLSIRKSEHTIEPGERGPQGAAPESIVFIGSG